MSIAGILHKASNLIGAVLIGADGITPDEERDARADGAGGAR